jgi:hypothetical protein
MRRRRQFSIAALMTVILCTGVILALLRDPNIESALEGLAIGGLLFAVLAGVVYVLFGCILLIVWLFRSFQPGNGGRSGSPP